MATFTVPATEPLSIAICTGSAWEILRVRLLSMAQARHAPAMASGPKNPPAVGVLMKDEPGKERGEDPFEVQEQTGGGGRTPGQSDHEQDGADQPAGQN